MPKEKKSATSAISSARTRRARRLDHRADRDLEALRRRVPSTAAMASSTQPRASSSSSRRDRERDHDLDDRVLAGRVAARRPPPSAPAPASRRAPASARRGARRGCRASGSARATTRRPRAGRSPRASRPVVACCTSSSSTDGQELVQRRVEQPDGDGQAVHRLEDLEEVGLLRDRAAARGRPPPPRGCRARIMRPHDRQAVLGEEHVLGAAQADALGAEVAGDGGVGARVGVGPHGQLALPDAVGPARGSSRTPPVARRRRGPSRRARPRRWCRRAR